MNGKEATKEMLKFFSKYWNANFSLIHKWQEIIFLSPRWWLGILLAIIPWLLWLRFHNKKYTSDLIRSGFLMMIICLIFNGLGVQLGLWIYPYDVFPFTPGYFPWDLTIFPVTIMSMIEIKPKWHPFYKALMFATFYLLGEPVAYLLNLYYPIHWKFYYSFPAYILLFLICNKVARSRVFDSKL